MRLIDADKLTETINKALETPCYNAYQDGYDAALNTLLDYIADMPTIPATQWISVKDRLPHNADEVLIYFSDGIVISGDYFDAVGFIPEHFYDGNGKISHWMPKLEPSDKRYKCHYADDNGVCSKCSGNGEIIYCVEGPCPYDMPMEDE